LPYRLSVGFLNQNGILRTGNFKRASTALNLSPTFLDNHLKVNFNFKGTYNTNVFANEGAIGNAIIFDPTQPVLSGNNRFGGYFEWLDPGTNRPNTLAPRNPVSLLMNSDFRSTVWRSIGNLQLDYSLHFLPDLHANVNVGYDYSIG
jgi:iron complex outermembrane receptor protein